MVLSGSVLEFTVQFLRKGHAVIFKALSKLSFVTFTIEVYLSFKLLPAVVSRHIDSVTCLGKAIFKFVGGVIAVARELDDKLSLIQGNCYSPRI